MMKTPNTTKPRERRLTKAFYSPAEVAELASVHPSTVLNYIRAGRLYAVRLSERTYRIPLKAVARLLYPERVKPPRVVRHEVSEAEFEAHWRKVSDEHDRGKRSRSRG